MNGDFVAEHGVIFGDSSFTVLVDVTFGIAQFDRVNLTDLLFYTKHLNPVVSP